jgi:hypothetical protein
MGCKAIIFEEPIEIEAAKNLQPLTFVSKSLARSACKQSQHILVETSQRLP